MTKRDKFFRIDSGVSPAEGFREYSINIPSIKTGRVREIRCWAESDNCASVKFRKWLDGRRGMSGFGIPSTPRSSSLWVLGIHRVGEFRRMDFIRLLSGEFGYIVDELEGGKDRCYCVLLVREDGKGLLWKDKTRFLGRWEMVHYEGFVGAVVYESVWRDSHRWHRKEREKELKGVLQRADMLRTCIYNCTALVGSTTLELSNVRNRVRKGDLL